MLWKCPACQEAIRSVEPAPADGTVYRCQVCRLELIVDRASDQLILAPLPDSTEVDDLARLDQPQTSNPPRLERRRRPRDS